MFTGIFSLFREDSRQLETLSCESVEKQKYKTFQRREQKHILTRKDLLVFVYIEQPILARKHFYA